MAGGLKSRDSLRLLVGLQVTKAKVVGGILAQGVAAHGHVAQAGNGTLEVAHLVVSETNLVLQRRLNLVLVHGCVLVEILRRLFVLLLLIISIPEQQLNFVGVLGRRRVLQRLSGVGNQAVVVAFPVIYLRNHGRHHRLVGVVLLGHGQVGAGGSVVAGAVAQVAGVVGAGVLVLALHLLVAVEQQPSLLVVFLLEVAVAQLKIGFGPLVIAQVVGCDLGKVADSRLVVFLVEVELAQLKVGGSGLRMGRVLCGEIQNQPLGIRMREVEAAHGVVVLGVGGAVGGGGTGLAGVHRLNGEVGPKGFLSRAVLAAVKQLQPFLKMPLIGGENLGLLGLSSHWRRSTQSGGQRQPGK